MHIGRSTADLGQNIPFLTFTFLCPQAMEETMEMDEKKFRFLIDGFPRNEDNLQGWTTVMEGKANVKFVLFFDCTSEVIKHLGGEDLPRGRGGEGMR